MNYEQLIKKLLSVSTDCIYPIYVPSIYRPAHNTYKNIIQNLPKEVQSRVLFVVRENQLEQYMKAQPDSRFLVIKNSTITPGFGLDSTHRVIVKHALKQGYDKIITMDDDLLFLSMVYQNESTHTTRRLNKEDRVMFAGSILALACTISNKWFDVRKDAVLGAFNRITPSTCSWEYGNVLLMSYKGTLPRQPKIINVARAQQIGAVRTGRYDLQAEDIGYCANVLEHGGSLFTLLPFLFDVPMEEDNKRTEVMLHKNRGDEKYLCKQAKSLLEETVIGDCLMTTAKFDDGTPRYFTINWKKYNKKYGTHPIVKEW